MRKRRGSGPRLPAGEFVGVTIRSRADLGPDARWGPGMAPADGGLLARLEPNLEGAGARFAYVRRLPPGGSMTVFFARLGTGADPPHLGTLTEWLQASRGVRARAVDAAVDRIREMDGRIQAWVEVRPQPGGDGPLGGVPFGVKEIVETAGLATGYGSPLYSGRVGAADAAIVHVLRETGAVLLGKTRSAAFAYITPSTTRNPRDLRHTPGGSSSGSAAAVAADMVPFAIGTQTRGSVLRPASYCGVTGFKPTFGLLPMEGVMPFAPSLDTLGFFTHTPSDMVALWAALGRGGGDAGECSVGVPDALPNVQPVMAAAFRETIDRIRRGGIEVRVHAGLAEMLVRLDEASNTVMFYEAAREHEPRFRDFGARLGDLAVLVREGLQMPAQRCETALAFIEECRSRVAELFRVTAVIATPAATGPAPLGLTSTGDASMNAPWTALGTPAIAFPMPVEDGLPLGLQLTAERGADLHLLAAAVRVDGV